MIILSGPSSTSHCSFPLSPRRRLSEEQMFNDHRYWGQETLDALCDSSYYVQESLENECKLFYNNCMPPFFEEMLV